jgi:antirestriction protein
MTEEEKQAIHSAFNELFTENTQEYALSKYMGEWHDFGHFAHDITDEEIPDAYKSYVDYEKMASDLFISDYKAFDCEDGNFLIFRQ